MRIYPCPAYGCNFVVSLEDLDTNFMEINKDLIIEDTSKTLETLNNEVIDLQPVLLYESVNGSTTLNGITLNDDISNYKYIDIYGIDVETQHRWNNKIATMGLSEVSTFVNYINNEYGGFKYHFVVSRITIKNRTLTGAKISWINLNDGSGNLTGTMGLSSGGTPTVYRVIGYK